MYELKILEIVDNEDGSATVQFDVSDDFVVWFCEHHKIEKFDQELFQKWIIESLEPAIEKYKDK